MTTTVLPAGPLDGFVAHYGINVAAIVEDGHVQAFVAYGHGPTPVVAAAMHAHARTVLGWTDPAWLADLAAADVTHGWAVQLPPPPGLTWGQVDHPGPWLQWDGVTAIDLDHAGQPAFPVTIAQL